MQQMEGRLSKAQHSQAQLLVAGGLHNHLQSSALRRPGIAYHGCHGTVGAGGRAGRVPGDATASAGGRPVGERARASDAAQS